MFDRTTFKDLVEWTEGELSAPDRSDFSVGQISTDSRTLKPGDVFLALRGDSFDGNLFIQEAAKLGALGVICESPEEVSIPKIKVKNGLGGLIAIGQKMRDLFQGPVFAITGSAGKSSTKDMVAVLLSDNTVSSPASFNNLMGVSRTLCLLKDTTKNLVLEMGMNNFGEILELCQRFKPYYGLITNIGDAHIGKLGGQEGIFRAKKEMFDFLSQSSQTRGIALNADDPWVMEAFKQSFPHFQESSLKVLSYSQQEKTADVFLQSQEMDPETGFLNLRISIGAEEVSFSLPIFGEHQAQNIIAAIAMVRLVDVPLVDIKKRMAEIKPAPHRGEIVTLSDRKILIDETYNSNPKALLSSLKSLTKMNHRRRKVLVLGEMRELGAFSSALHDEIGEFLVSWITQEKPLLKLVTVQGDARRISDRVIRSCPHIETHHVDDVKALMKDLPKWLKPQDIVFLKGSRGVKLDSVLSVLG